MITIRLAGPDDVAQACTLLAQQLDEHGSAVTRARLASAVRTLVAQPALGRLLLACLDERVIGVAQLSFIWTIEHGGRSLWLDELFVDPAHRDHGIGRQLLHAAIALARQEGCLALDLEVDADHARVEGLYKRERFRPLPRRRWVRSLD